MQLDGAKKDNRNMIESLTFIDLGRIYVGSEKVDKLPLSRAYRRP
tara:strand:+ start:387 stop:521 length:135 start_codon:yes stop_codon:yes gene_type:complete